MIEPTALYGGNADFLETLYEQYRRDPSSVEPKWREYFGGIAPPVSGGDRDHAAIRTEIAERARRAPVASPATAQGGGDAAKQASVSRLI
jgi:2-oxoglutarate dehydrogenase E1 component